MHLVEEYPIGTAGNTCYLCNASKRPGERLIDLERQIDFEGYLVVCESCVTTMGQLLGFVPFDAAEALRLEVKAVKKDNSYLKRKVKGLQEIQTLIKQYGEDALDLVGADG